MGGGLRLGFSVSGADLRAEKRDARRDLVGAASGRRACFSAEGLEKEEEDDDEDVFMVEADVDAALLLVVLFELGARREVLEVLW